MKKTISSIIIVTLLILGVFVVPGIIHAQTALAGATSSASGGIGSTIADGIASTATAWLGVIINTLIYIVLTGAALLLWLSGLILDTCMYYLVVTMNATINGGATGLFGPAGIPAIYQVWTTMRDLANMFLIFIILYIAIKTILGSSDYKKMLTSVIIVALFINFSLFFTNIMVDASNIMSTVFYNAIVGSDKSCVGGTSGCLTYRVISDLNLGSIYQKDPVSWAAETQNLTLGIMSKFAAIFVLLSAAVVFLISSVLLIKRFITLIMAMMFSSVGFAAQALPETKKYWDMWWKTLTKECISTPVYFLFLWVVFNIMGNLHITASLTAALDQGGNAIAGTGGATFGSSAASLIIEYTLILGLLAIAPMVASEMGASGGKLAQSISDKFDVFGKWQKTGQNLVQYPTRKVAEYSARGTAATINYGLDKVGKVGGTAGNSVATSIGRSLGYTGDDLKAFGKRGAAIGGTLGTTGYIGKRIADNTSKPLVEKVEIFGKTAKQYQTDYRDYEKKRIEAGEIAAKKKEFEAAVATGNPDTIEKAVRKAGAGIVNMNPELLKDAKVVLHLSKSQLEAIDKASDETMQKSDRKAIGGARKSYNQKSIKDATDNLDAQKALGPGNAINIKSAEESLNKKVRDMGDEIGKLDFDVLNTANVVGRISKKQMESLKNNIEFTTATMAKLYETRMKSIKTNLDDLRNKRRIGAPALDIQTAKEALHKEIQNMGDEIGKLDFAVLNDPDVIGGLSREQVNHLKKDDELKGQVSVLFKTRVKPLVDAIAGAPGALSVDNAVRELSPEDFGYVPTADLVHISRNCKLNIAALKIIQGHKDPTERASIKVAVEAYLRSPAGIAPGAAARATRKIEDWFDQDGKNF